MLAMASYPIAAQEDEAEKVEVNIQITKDGKTETIVREFEVPAETSDWDFDVEEGEDQKIIIRKHIEHGDHPFVGEMHEDMEMRKVAFLGVQGYTINADSDGPKSVRITKVIEGEAAEKAGLKNEDILVSIDGESITTYPQLIKVIRSKTPGDAIEVKVIRDGTIKQMKVTLGEKELPDWSSFQHMNHWKDFDGLENVEVRVVRRGHSISETDRKLIEKATGVEPSDNHTFDDVEVQIFPNPADDVISYKITLEEGGKLDMMLMDSSGKVLENKTLSDKSGSYEGDISLDDKPEGSYLLIFKRGDKMLTEKVVKR